MPTTSAKPTQQVFVQVEVLFQLPPETVQAWQNQKDPDQFNRPEAITALRAELADPECFRVIGVQPGDLLNEEMEAAS